MDYLLRVSMRRDALQDTVARHGATLIEPLLPQVATRLEREATAAIEQLEPWSRLPEEEGLKRLCRMCLVLARFEQLFRARLFVLEYVYEPLLDDPDLQEYASRIVPEECVEDLLRLAPIVIGDHRDLANAEPLTLNPTFALSTALGGADADLIAAGLLLDWKSSASNRVVKREDIWQLVGYALSDSDDQHQIHAVGISALRRRSRIVWSLDGLLVALSGSPRRPLVAWRSDFAEVVHALRPHALRRR